MRRSPIRVLCIDDSRLVAHALERRFAFEPTLHWVGWVEHSADALRVVRASSPDIVLLDIDMPGGDSFGLVHALAEVLPTVRVVMFSGHVRADYADRAMDAGAWGYLSKNQSMSEILAAIERVAGGQFVLTPELEHDDGSAGEHAGARTL